MNGGGVMIGGGVMVGGEVMVGELCKSRYPDACQWRAETQSEGPPTPDWPPPRTLRPRDARSLCIAVGFGK